MKTWIEQVMEQAEQYAQAYELWFNCDKQMHEPRLIKEREKLRDLLEEQYLLTAHLGSM